jgi:hypothetical protein
MLPQKGLRLSPSSAYYPCTSLLSSALKLALATSVNSSFLFSSPVDFFWSSSFPPLRMGDLTA